MNKKEKKLPSTFKVTDPCHLSFGHGMQADNCTILKVHFSNSGISYDVEAILSPVNDPELKNSGWHRARFYNVDQRFVIKPKNPTK